MVNIISVAKELEYLKIPDNTLINIEEMKIILMTSWYLLQQEVRENQWQPFQEWQPSLHRKVSIKPGDTYCV